MKIDPRSAEAFGRLLTSIVVPRPIAFVSSVSSDGVPNLAPFSFYNAVSSSPPTLVIATARRTKSKLKDTLANIEATGEFVVNVVVDRIAEAMNRTAAEYPSEVDEFRVAGLTPAPSVAVVPPRVAESPVSMECCLDRVVAIGSGESETGLVIGEIVLVHVDDRVVRDGRVDHGLLKPTGRLSGAGYCHTGDAFKMVRPVYEGDS